MKRKDLFILFFTVALFYSFIFILSRGTEPLFFMGTGWRFYKISEKTVTKEIEVYTFKGGEKVFLKDIKIYPECSGFIHEDIKENLLSFSFDSYLLIPLRMIIPDVKAKDLVVIEIEEKVIKGDAINYIFGLPVRIEKVELKKPIKLKGVKIRKGE